MNLNGLAANDVENKVGFDNEDEITRAFELIVSRDSTKKRMGFQITNKLIKLIDKCCCPRRTVMGNPVEDGD